MNGLRKDEKFGTTNSRKILHLDESLTAYSQLINLGNQSVTGGTRTQLTDDGQGFGTVSTKTLWNSVDNRINLLDARVNSYIDVGIVLASQTSAGVFQASIQLDYSPSLDGSQVITVPITRYIEYTGGVTVALHYSFKFIVTQDMKDNGIGIMVTPYASYTLENTRLTIERLVVPT